MTTTMAFTTRIIKNLGTNSMSIGLSSIIYMLSAVCFAKMASSDVCMKLGVRTCITVTFLTTALYCVLVPQCSSVYMIFVLQILPGMATGILFTTRIKVNSYGLLPSGVCFRNDFISYDLWKYCKSFFNAICLFVFSSDLFHCSKYFFYIL